jgi:glycosyltransferase involved in cell wall biosynthesis
MTTDREPRPSVSVVIVNYNSGLDLTGCLSSIKRQVPQPKEVIVIDNASTDGSLISAEVAFPQLTYVANNSNEGFAAGANAGAARATGDILLFVNPDVLLSEDCISRLVAALQEKPGVAGPVLTIDADFSEDRGATIDRFGHPSWLEKGQLPLYVAGSALATSRDFFFGLGGFDSRYFMFAEDLDYCWRVLLAGGEVSVANAAHGQHRGGGTAVGGYIRYGQLQTSAFRVAFRERNTLATLIKCAPSYWFPWLVPLCLVQTLVFSAGALAMGQPRLAQALLRGIVWNVRQLPRTLGLRRAIRAVPNGQKVAISRVSAGYVVIDLLRRFGLPHFVLGRESVP